KKNTKALYAEECWVKKEVKIPRQPDSYTTENVEYKIFELYVKKNQYVFPNQRLFDVEATDVILEVVAERGGIVETLDIELYKEVFPDDIAIVIDESRPPTLFAGILIWVLNKYFISGIVLGALITYFLQRIF
ncbi:hypothetical protein, partial [Glaciecola sp. SC05]|uniref:hypothetical protein n=1 Tax=Glaciecola sp. SC05 TaxID=1987355 RepID=UPI0035294B74